jgi:hypothetical protein
LLLSRKENARAEMDSKMPVAAPGQAN